MKSSNQPIQLPVASSHASDDTTTAPIIAENDILKFFNIERNDVQTFQITHKSDGIYIRIRLNPRYHPCPVCGHMVKRIKDYCEKKIVHSVLTNRQCFIIYEARRYQCPHCHKTFLEHNPFSFGKARISVATVFNVLQDLRSPAATFTEVAARHHISTTSAIRIFDEHVRIPRRPLPRCIGIDEVYAFKTHDSRYVCVLVDLLDQKIIDVLPSRRKDVLLNYFTLIPRKEREKVRYCSFDMWETYRTVAKIVFPNVTCSVDRFHVQQELSRCVDRVRLSVQKKYQTQIALLTQKAKDKTITSEERLLLEKADRHYYVLKKFNWLFFSSNRKILDPNVEKRFNRKLQGYYNYYDLFHYMTDDDDDLNTAYTLQYMTRKFYENCNYQDAKKELEKLIIEFRSCSLEELTPFANTLTRWKNEIIHSFIIVDKEKNRKMNTSIVENRNKTIKLIKHASNGFLNWERFRGKIMWCLNDDATFYLNCIKKGDEII